MNDRREQLRRRLNLIFQEAFDDQTMEVFNEMTANDVPAWDSLMQITLVVSIEKEFQIRLKAEEVGQLKNVGEMLDILEKRGS